VRGDAGALLERTGGVRKIRLVDAELSGDVNVMEGRSGKVRKILEQERLVSEHSGYATLLRPFLEPHLDEQWNAVKAMLLVPRHDDAEIWAGRMQQEQARADALAQEFAAASRQCDDLVFEWYGFQPDEPLRENIDLGLPWQYRNARQRREAILGT
jgi:hypothetical protein